MLISISGVKGAGKDTMGELFKKDNPKAQQLTFAGELRKETQHFINNIRWGNQEKPKDMTDEVFNKIKELSLKDPSEDVYMHTDNMVTILQLYGTDYRRNNDKDYWTNKVKQIIQNNPDQTYYITDARFKNEFDLLKELDALMVKLEVNTDNQIKRLYERDSYIPSEEQLNHKSEQDVKTYNDFDIIINTDNKEPEEVYNIIKGEINNMKDLNFDEKYQEEMETLLEKLTKAEGQARTIEELIKADKESAEKENELLKKYKEEER